MGRSACGVRGILLKEGDEVAGCTLVEAGKTLVTITEGGFGKRTPFDEFARRNRGGSGLRCHKVTDKTGNIAGVAAVSEDDDLMMITSDGTIIRVPVNEISVIGRDAQGVIVMRLAEGDRVVNFARLESESEQDEKIVAADAAEVVESAAETEESDD